LILVDTSVWVDHPRHGEPGLFELLERSAVVMHPFVVGEIACGSLRDRDSILELLQDLPAAVVAEAAEVMHFIERHALHGKGIGYVDVHLLASVVLTGGSRLWTRDLKLLRVAASLGCVHPEPAH
jgi:predicted nucleic acid-binding protein